MENLSNEYFEVQSSSHQIDRGQPSYDDLQYHNKNSPIQTVWQQLWMQMMCDSLRRWVLFLGEELLLYLSFHSKGHERWSCHLQYYKQSNVHAYTEKRLFEGFDGWCRYIDPVQLIDQTALTLRLSQRMGKQGIFKSSIANKQALETVETKLWVTLYARKVAIYFQSR